MKKLHALEISLTVGCRLNCLYCPQKLFVNRYLEISETGCTKLSFEDFKTALDKVQDGATISFCGMSEPFHNESCAEMILYAYEKGYKISLLTTLVGMSPADFEKIKSVKFDSFVLHIPDKENHSKFVITPEYLSMLECVVDSIDIDYYSCHGTVHDAVADIIDKNKYAGISLGDRAGNLDISDVTHRSAVQGEIACYHGSERQVGGWAPVMLPDGTLVLCCQDYGLKHVLGNLLNQDWESIMSGEAYSYFRRGLRDSSLDILCRTCSDACRKCDMPAVRIGKIIDFQKQDGQSGKNDNIFAKISQAENICVYGTGKLFRDHFEQEYWREGLNVKYLVDRKFSGETDDEIRETYEAMGISCIVPEELIKVAKPFVIIFIKNSKDIENYLVSMGIFEFASIDDLLAEYKCCGQGKDMRHLTKRQE